MTTWIRSVQTSTDWITGTALLASIASGRTLLRVHFEWGFYGDTPLEIDVANTAANLQAFGLVTTIGNGTETVPDARTESFDAAPPTQRWIYWEARAPVVTAIDAAAGIITWRDSGPQALGSTKGQVIATGIPGGDTLNLWASWAAGYFWESLGSTQFWVAASILTTT